MHIYLPPPVDGGQSTMTQPETDLDSDSDNQMDGEQQQTELPPINDPEHRVWRNNLSNMLIDQFNYKNLSDSLSSVSKIDQLAYAIFAEQARLANQTIVGDDDSGSQTIVEASDAPLAPQVRPSMDKQPSVASPPEAGDSKNPKAATATTTTQNRGEKAPAAPPPPPALANPRPYYGDSLFSFQMWYWPFHCVICLVICITGSLANVANIIVLTRPNMVSAVNTILSAMAFSDFLVNISNIPYLVHGLSDSSNAASFFSFKWALYILFHAHTTVTAHTISIWLTCLLATWRYFVVCRSQSTNQRNWSVGLAKRTIVGVFLIVPIFCIPNYLSFAIVEEVAMDNPNLTMYKVGFSQLADESKFIKTFHFWIFSCLTKLVPCVLLTFFTTVLIRKLLSARERRLRLASYGASQRKETDITGLHEGHHQPKANSNNNIITNNSNQITNNRDKKNNNNNRIVIGGDDNNNQVIINGTSTNTNTNTTATTTTSGNGGAFHHLSPSPSTSTQSTHSVGGNQGKQQAMMSRLMVESVANQNTVSTSTIPISVGAEGEDDSCDNNTSSMAALNERRTCQMAGLGGTVSQDRGLLSGCGGGQGQGQGGGRGSLGPLVGSTGCLSQDTTNNGPMMMGLREKRPSESALNQNNNASGQRVRSMGSTTMAPFQVVKIQSSHRQLSQNETTTRLLIAVMIVFLICESPAGILALLCAVLGQDFFENVYQPMGILTDLLALINSTLNFFLYCSMSAQFRTTIHGFFSGYLKY